MRTCGRAYSYNGFERMLAFGRLTMRPLLLPFRYSQRLLYGAVKTDARSPSPLDGGGTAKDAPASFFITSCRQAVVKPIIPLPARKAVKSKKRCMAVMDPGAITVRDNEQEYV